MLLVAALCLGAFVLWFALEPRMVWPGFLLTFGLGALLASVLGTLVADTQLASLAWGWSPGWLSTWLVSALAPLLTALFLIATSAVLWRQSGGMTAPAAGLTGVAFASYGGLAVAALVRPWADEMLLLIALGIPVTVISVGFVAFVVYAHWYAWYFSRFGRNFDAVIVLGGALRDGRTVSPLLARRVERGIAQARLAWDAGRDVPLVMSGGQGSDEQVPEAQAMREYAVELGVDEQRIIEEDRSTNTQENLVFTATVLRERGIVGRVAVATSNYHAFRAATMMRAAGVDGYAVGYRTVRATWFPAVLREYFAVLRDHRLFTVVVGCLSCLPALAWLVAAVG